jgi:hypothetical protein
VKKFSPAFVFLSISFIVVFFSCKKINEATDLGGNLIPGVDNVNTFEIALNTVTKNALTSDTAKVFSTDQIALGDINDPEFGHVHANFCVNFSAPAYKSYPFLPRKDTTHAIDSVVLSLRYAGAYGDTISNGTQTVNVYEIPYTGATSSLRTDIYYRYNDPASDFTGTQIGSSTFTINRIKDSFDVINPGDTFKVANVVRIKLNSSLGTKLAQMDTTSSGGGYYSDSLFKTFFNGLAIKATNTGNALSYFSLTDTATKIIVYYKYNLNGKDTTGIVQYYHNTSYGQSNYVNVQPGGNWLTALNNLSADKVYIQSSPSGSYASIVIPGLDTMSNKVIHRAEIIATKISSASDNIFTAPPRLFLDRIRTGSKDSSLIFEKDLLISSDFSIGFNTFGGILSNDMYRFDITRYVQGVVTSNKQNDTLRLWAPFEAYESNAAYYTPNSLPVNGRIAEGRVVLGGGAYIDPNSRLRLRIVYSKL